MPLIERLADENYAATLVQLEAFEDLPGCDNIKHAIVCGSRVVVGKDAKAGDVGLFFPLETAINLTFLGTNNLFEDNTCNEDRHKKGFFKKRGRVRAVRLRGFVSEGFFAPFDFLYACFPEKTVEAVVKQAFGTVFDTIDGVELCRKYVPPQPPSAAPGKKQAKQLKRVSAASRIVPGQFQFHTSTSHLKRNIHLIDPTSRLVISDKWHGTSGIIANVLVNRSLSLWERLLVKCGVKVSTKEYKTAYSSRMVVKGFTGEVAKHDGHYKSNPWSVAAEEHPIPKGFSIYFEIVGYTPHGAFIQKGYHYGCVEGGSRVVVYRVTFTNEDGYVHELSWNDMVAFCLKNRLEPVRLLFAGRASELVPVRAGEFWTDWQARLLDYLNNTYAQDTPCRYNNGEVPTEGVVVRIENVDGTIKALKLKTFAFCARETTLLDGGEVDMETTGGVDE